MFISFASILNSLVEQKNVKNTFTKTFLGYLQYVLSVTTLQGTSFKSLIYVIDLMSLRFYVSIKVPTGVTILLVTDYQ